MFIWRYSLVHQNTEKPKCTISTRTHEESLRVLSLFRFNSQNRDQIYLLPLHRTNLNFFVEICESLFGKDNAFKINRVIFSCCISFPLGLPQRAILERKFQIFSRTKILQALRYLKSHHKKLSGNYRKLL